MATHQRKTKSQSTDNDENADLVPDRKPLQSDNLGKQGDITVAILTLLIFGTIMSVAVFRATLIVHANEFLSAFREFVSVKWGIFYDYYEGDFLRMGAALYTVAVVEHCALGMIFLAIDLTGKPHFITKYKVQSDETEIPVAKLVNALWTVFLNQTLYAIPMLAILYNLMTWRKCGLAPDELPTFFSLVLELVVFVIVDEIGFYYSHRLVHQPLLYKSIHKTHHEWTAPIGMITMYCHPVEQFLANILPAATGPILMGSHLLTITCWFIVAQSVSMIHHCGYHLPFLPSPEFHDYHHLKFTNNFGVLGFLDWLHGTDANFIRGKQYLRHKTSFSLKPMNDLIPDDDPKTD